MAVQRHVAGYHSPIVLFGITQSIFELLTIFHRTRVPHAKQDTKPISGTEQTNPVTAAQLVGGEKVLIKSFPGGDWKQGGRFTMLAMHDNIAKYKGHIQDAQTQKTSIVIESCGMLLSKFLEKSVAEQQVGRGGSG